MLTGNHPGCSLNELQALKGDGLQPYFRADILRKMGLSDLTSKEKQKEQLLTKATLLTSAASPTPISHYTFTSGYYSPQR